MRIAKRNTAATVAFLVLLACSSNVAHVHAEASINSREIVEYLASPELKGRLTGSAEGEKAAQYLADKLKSLGVSPLPGQEGYLLPFEFTAGLKDDGTTIQYSAGGNSHTFSDRTDVQVLSFSETTTVTAPVVFAGYGIYTNEESGFAYDSFAGLDLKDKIVLVFRYYPENIDQSKRIILSQRAAELRTKAQIARERGAKGLIVTSGPAYAPGADIVPLTFDATVAGSSIAAASISSNVARQLFEAAGKGWQEVEVLQRRLDGGDPAAKGFDLPGVTVTLDARIAREKKLAHNVVGYLPANGESPVFTEWIGVGAHFDHLGDGSNVSNSLARDGERGLPHVGADDNASGVAATLAAAEALSRTKRNRPVFLAFWSGEEIGLLGSASFVRGGVIPTEQLATFVNLDMVGRSVDNKFSVLGVGSSPAWAGLVEAANRGVDFTVATSQDPYTPSDSMNFYLAGVPAVHLFTGTHEDYHRPSDTADKLNYPDLDRVGRFTANLVQELANAETKIPYAKVERTFVPRMGGSRSGSRVYTGTIPDYAAESNGLLLSGVVEGSPAANAELKGGDIITEFGGRRIANIHEYMTVLEGVKAGEEVKVVYTRAGETRETVIVPGTRK